MKYMGTEKMVCSKCGVELDVPMYENGNMKKYGFKHCHQCGVALLNPEEKETLLSIRQGIAAKYDYTQEQVTAYWQGVEDCAKGTIDKRQKCELKILAGSSGTGVSINNYRVTDGKLYGMLVTEAHYKLNCCDVIHAICKEHEQEG